MVASIRTPPPHHAAIRPQRAPDHRGFHRAISIDDGLGLLQFDLMPHLLMSGAKFCKNGIP